MARVPRGTSPAKAREIADKYFDLETGTEGPTPGEYDPVDHGYRTDPPGRHRRATAAPPPPPKVLTPKERRFVAEYLVDTNATQAAIRAGYSEKTARAIGYENLTKPHIRKLVDAAISADLTKIGWDAERVKNRLNDELQADLSDLYNPDGSFRPVHEWPLIWRQGLITGIESEERLDGDALAEGEAKTVVIRKIKFSTRIKQLELMGKHASVGAFRDRVEHDVAEPLKQLYEQLVGNGIRPREIAPPADIPVPNAIRPKDANP